MKCPYCNKEFIQKYSWVKYCSPYCRIKQQRIRNKPSKLIQDRKYAALHKKQKREYDKIYRLTHKKQKYETDKIYRLNHMNKHNEQNRLWRKRHPEKNRLVQYNNYHKHKKFDPQFKLAGNLRARVRQALQGKYKFDSTEKLIGCSFEECWIYLEKQFRTGMTRKNMGPVWQIDHIKPCSSFDLNNEEEQRKCFHYTNLQPLFIEENLKKGSKIHWDRE